MGKEKKDYREGKKNSAQGINNNNNNNNNN
jgi:hypothetical protein